MTVPSTKQCPLVIKWAAEMGVRVEVQQLQSAPTINYIDMTSLRQPVTRGWPSFPVGSANTVTINTCFDAWYTVCCTFNRSIIMGSPQRNFLGSLLGSTRSHMTDPLSPRAPTHEKAVWQSFFQLTVLATHQLNTCTPLAIGGSAKPSTDAIQVNL